MRTSRMRLPLASTSDAVRAAATARRAARHLGADTAMQASLFSAVLEAAARFHRACSGGHIDIESATSADLTVLLRAQLEGRLPHLPHDDSVANAAMLSTWARDLSGPGIEARCRIDESSMLVLALGCEWPQAQESARRTRGDDMQADVAAADVDAEVAVVEELIRLNDAFRCATRDAGRAREDLSRLSRELDETNRGVVALYAELDERADELRRADQAKTRFLSNVSHELRTPLNSIRALAGLLRDRLDGPLNDEQLKQVNFIHTAADELRQTVDDLLDIAKIAAGKNDVRCVPFAITDLFGALRGTLKPLLAGSVRLHFEDASALPMMVGDEAKIAQILRNLVSNALKFTEAGEVRVAASASPDGRMVHFRVADTGIGIAAEDRDRIFEEFVQIANPLQSRSKGTGLGLPLCRRLAMLLGGSIQVDGAPGKGSTFTVALPRIQATAGVDAGDATLDAESAIDQARSVASGAGLLVLLIDDDATARYAVRRRLEDMGVAIAEAEGGTSGLEAIRRIAPHLIVLDLQLPDMHGIDVLRRVRSAADTRSLPVAVLTSLELDEAQRAELAFERVLLLSKKDIDAADFSRRLFDLAATTAVRTD